MMIELYAHPSTPDGPQLPISNPTGVLPEGEPALELSELLGSFSRREEALSFIRQLVSQGNGELVEMQSGTFNDYAHIEWVTMQIKTADNQAQIRSYYLMTDEGY